MKAIYNIIKKMTAFSFLTTKNMFCLTRALWEIPSVKILFL